jgi:hypothetical protein
MAKKYTSIGLYKKPGDKYQDGNPIPEDKQRAFVSVYLPKKGPETITIGKGDVLSFTTKANKLKELTSSFENKKISEETYNSLVDIYGADDVIAEVTLVQNN